MYNFGKVVCGFADFFVVVLLLEPSLRVAVLGGG
jgi:hypothetical protein